MSTTLTIGGSSVSIPTDVILHRFAPYNKGSYPTLSFAVRGELLAGLPDPYLGKEAILAIGGTTYFTGNVISGPACSYNTTYGWVRTYQCAGLRYRLDRFPHTDSNTGVASSGFNLHPEDPSYIGSRAGRTVGQILASCLTMDANANTADSYGIGNYASLGPAVLSTQTLTDLAQLLTIPPAPTYFGSERFGTAIESLLHSWAPNHFFWLDPVTGEYRFSDLRKFTAHTFTLDTDPIEPTPLARMCSSNFPRVRVRGGPLVNGILLDTAGGGLAEDFAYDALNNAAAKAAWTVADFQQPTLAGAKAADTGTCTCPSTTTVTVTSANGASTWTSDFWDQTSTGRHGIIYLTYGAGSGITQYTTRRIIANTSLSAGGTSTLTLDIPLAITSYTAYQIIALSGGASNVWRQYSITNATVAAALANQFSYPQPFRLAQNNGAMLTSFPIGSVVATGGNEITAWFTSDSSSGTILFTQPTYIVAGNANPSNVRALVAVNQGPQAAIWPPDAYAPGTLTAGVVTGHGTIVPGSGFGVASAGAQVYVIGDGSGATATCTISGAAVTAIAITAGGSGYTWAVIAVVDPTGSAAAQYGGTSSTIEGLTDTLTITIGAWRDPGNFAGMLAYAYDLFQSVCDTVVEGSIRYLGLYTGALTPGLAVNVTGSSFTTGWESPLTSFAGFGGLAVTAVEVEWPPGDMTDHITTMHVGNHRAQCGQSTFLRPNRTGLSVTGGMQGQGGFAGKQAPNIGSQTGDPSSVGTGGVNTPNLGSLAPGTPGGPDPSSYF